ncbi:MAG: hypothetical protein IJM30_02685 [Thermoguttaceae bacterium]|nr:hypothetical protein [Thermoguttaceae bacterium]
MTQAAQAKYDATSKRIEAQHEEALLKLDELDRKIEAFIARWAPSANVEPIAQGRG